MDWKQCISLISAAVFLSLCSVIIGNCSEETVKAKEETRRVCLVSCNNGPHFTHDSCVEHCLCRR